MRHADERDELDALLDTALRDYVTAEPRAGLERRVLARALSERPRLRASGWGLATACALVAALAISIYRWPAAGPGPQSLLVVAGPAIQPLRSGPIVRQPGTQQVRRIHRASKCTGRYQPPPMSAEEQLMQQWAALQSQVLDNRFAADEQELRPIQVERVRIEPLADAAALEE